MEIRSKDYSFKDDDIFLESITCVYVQEPDCTEDREGDSQEIIISSRDGGGGKFFNIKTQNWSFCEDQFTQLINDFQHRMDYETIDSTRCPRS